MDYTQVVIGVLSIMLMGSMLIYVLRRLQKQIDIKADKALCDERHNRIDQDLERGRGEFKEFRDEIKVMTTAQNKTNTNLELIMQKMDIYIKQTCSDRLSKDGPE